LTATPGMMETSMQDILKLALARLVVTLSPMS
jgi:hypothetical protein